MKLYVCLVADTEDNHPNYVPRWEKLGTNYDSKNVEPKFDWLKYWDVLLKELKDFPITWLFRVDTCIKDKALTSFKPFLKKLAKHEIGIHIHTLDYDGTIWRQTLDPEKEKKIVDESIRIFKKTMGFVPISSRMGWNYMSNSVMNALEDNDIKYDCSAVPNYFSKGFYNKRDNIIDWRDSPKMPYNPSIKNYKTCGTMNLVEVPISSSKNKNLVYSNSITKILNLMPSIFRKKFTLFCAAVIKKLAINPHSNFIISSYWNPSGNKKIIDQYAKIVERGQTQLLIGYFHPSELLDPIKNDLNSEFLKNILELIDYVKNQKVEVVPITLSQVSEIRWNQ